MRDSMEPMDAAWSVLKADPFYRVHHIDDKGRVTSQAMHPAIAGYHHRKLFPGNDPDIRDQRHRRAQANRLRELQDLTYASTQRHLDNLREKVFSHDPKLFPEGLPKEIKDAILDNQERLNDMFNQKLQAETGSLRQGPLELYQSTPSPYTHLPELQEKTDWRAGRIRPRIGGRIELSPTPKNSYSQGLDTEHSDFDINSALPYGDEQVGFSVSNRSEKRTPDRLINLLQIPQAMSMANYFRGGVDMRKPQEYAPLSSQQLEEFDMAFKDYMNMNRRSNIGNPDNIQMLPGNFMQLV